MKRRVRQFLVGLAVAGFGLLTAASRTTAATAAVAAGLSEEPPGRPDSARREPREAIDEQRLQGRFVFEQHCVPCHGKRGNGRGELAVGTIPRPRDFTRGLFKYRSTPSGFLPTDEDLLRTLRGGLAGTAMPAFTQLPENDARAVLRYVKSLSPRWRNPANHAPALRVPTVPDWMNDPGQRRVRAEVGREIFQRACAACHGTGGAGDGPAAKGLLDEWEQPCPPRDLGRQPLRSGTGPEALHRTLMTGLDGTPMPSFRDSTTETDRWDLVAFLLERRQSANDEKNFPANCVADCLRRAICCYTVYKHKS